MRSTNTPPGAKPLGLFITFEGGEGGGKSTQIARLQERLEAAGHRVLRTREPGGTALGEALRQLLQHDAAGQGMSPEAELLLFAASRAQHVRESIAPALAAGQIVLCDRFLDSTTVYQGVARAIDAGKVQAINQFAVGTTRPNLTFLIDLPPEIGLARIRARGRGELDRMEQETLEFFQAVRQGYLDVAGKEAARFQILDGSQSIETTANTIWECVVARLRANAAVPP